MAALGSRKLVCLYLRSSRRAVALRYKGACRGRAPRLRCIGTSGSGLADPPALFVLRSSNLAHKTGAGILYTEIN